MSIEKAEKILNAPDLLESGLKLKAISKILPNINPFIQGAVTAGYGANQIIDFLKEKLYSAKERREYSRLSERERSGIARPDERLELSKYDRRQDTFDVVGGLGRVGASIAGGIGAKQAEAQAQQSLQEKLEASEKQREFYRGTAEEKLALQQQKFEQQMQAMQEQQRVAQERLALSEQRFKESQEQAAFSRERQLERDVARQAHMAKQEARLLEAERRQQEAHQARMQKQSGQSESSNSGGSLSKDLKNLNKLTRREVLKKLDEEIVDLYS